jgi:3-oxoadipate enol-lactonase
MIQVPLPDGGQVSVRAEGATGPSLVLLRPLGGSMASWGPFAGVLGRRTRVVMFDPRGAGRSSMAPLGMTTRRMAGDAVAVLDALHIDRAHVYGLSLGGMVACWLAVDAPARVDRLVLASTPLRGLALRSGSIGRTLSLIRCLARPARAAQMCLAARILSSCFRTTYPAEVERIQARAAAVPGSHRGLLALLWAAAAHDMWHSLGAIKAETLVLAGECDRLLDADAQRQLAVALPHGRFTALAGAGHDVSAEAPRAVAALVLRHILAPDS